MSLLSFIWMWQDQMLASDKEKSSHLIFITAFSLVCIVAQNDPYITDWVTNPGQVPRKFKLTTYQSKCGVLAYWAIRNTL